jgi:hypothetical protein
VMTHAEEGGVEFKTLMSYIRALRSRYLRTLSAFYAYEALKEIRAPNLIGNDEAQANVDAVKRYKSFFPVAEEALGVFFFIELAKLFDASNQSLHINKVVDYTEQNRCKLTSAAFETYSEGSDRAFLQELVQSYEGVEEKDIKEVRRLLSIHENLIKKLKTYRDKWLAHDDEKKPTLPEITGIEIRELFDVLAKILNLLTYKLNSSSAMWDHIEPDMKSGVKAIISDLRRFHPYRLKEIEDECQRSICTEAEGGGGER